MRGVLRAGQHPGASGDPPGGTVTAASRLLADLAGLTVGAKTIERVGETDGLAAEAEQAERAIEIVTGRLVPLPPAPPPGRPVPDMLYVAVDGTGVPMRSAETAGRQGKGPDGRSRTREVKLAALFTQTTTTDDGHSVRDEHSTSYLASFENSEVFGKLTEAAALQRGHDHIRQTVILGDGARWIWNLADRHFANATQIVDLFHAREHLHELASRLKFIVADPPAWLAARLTELDAGQIEALAAAARHYHRDLAGPIAEQVNKAVPLAEVGVAHAVGIGFEVGGTTPEPTNMPQAGCKAVIGPTPQTLRHALEHPRRHRHHHPALPPRQRRLTPLPTNLARTPARSLTAVLSERPATIIAGSFTWSGGCCVGAPASSRSVGSHLLERLNEHVVDNAAYWDFRKNDRRSHGHALFPYPAMMVPQLQGVLLDDLLAVDASVEWCYDPFAGSGTILTECMRRGLNFIGSDLNPLAVLIMTVKARPLREQTLRAAVARVLTTARRHRVTSVEFRGRDKWFSADAVDGLSRLRAAIQDEPGRPTRRFLWVCLAATVRLVSNSRTSTFKLHSYSAEVLSAREVQPIEIFQRLAEAAVEQMDEQHAELTAAGRLAYGRYEHDVQVLHTDILSGVGWPNGIKADVLMTSPPYGDNRTTVPYGQHSYLPLMWIGRQDLPAEGDITSLLGNPYRLDVASIGGRRVVDADARLRELSERSPMVAATARELAEAGGDGVDRFIAFCSDMDEAIEIIGPRLRPSAFQFWTLGSRRICGQLVPTSRIVSELSASHGATELVTIHRRFPKNAKRMATRNDSVALMDTEQILVMQSSTRKSASVGASGSETRSRGR